MLAGFSCDMLEILTVVGAKNGGIAHVRGGLVVHRARLGNKLVGRAQRVINAHSVIRHVTSFYLSDLRREVEQSLVVEHPPVMALGSMACERYEVVEDDFVEGAFSARSLCSDGGVDGISSSIADRREHCIIEECLGGMCVANAGPQNMSRDVSAPRALSQAEHGCDGGSLDHGVAHSHDGHVLERGRGDEGARAGTSTDTTARRSMAS